jgi:hypothetical protein
MQSSPADETELSYEQRLRARLELLKTQMKAGKVKFASGLNVVESLERVRYAPDGEIDLETVDPLVRSLALAVDGMHQREESKKQLPLAEIQHQYFGFIEANFGRFFNVMTEGGFTPHDVAMTLTRDSTVVNETVAQIPGFMEAITDFWDAAGGVARAHVEDIDSALKGVFGGDLFPSHSENIASKCGLYTDTLVLPCPYLRPSGLLARWDSRKRAYYLIKHAMNLLQYKDLACADVSPPIVVVLPSLSLTDKSDREYFIERGKADALTHAERIFGVRFSAFEEFKEFTDRLDTIGSVVEAVRDSSRLLFDTEWEGDFKSKLLRATQDQHAHLVGSRHPGLIVWGECVRATNFFTRQTNSVAFQ